MSWKQGSGKGPWGSRPPSTPPGGGGPQRDNTPPPDFDEFFRKSQEAFRRMFGGGGGKGGSIAPFIIVAVILLVLWGASGFYRVDADEQGVVMRFGQYHRISQPGLNYHMPYPIETVFTPKVTTINREQVGFRSTGGDIYRTDRRNIIPEESLMLTGDKNIVSAQFEVQWRINDAEKFLFNMRDPQYMVKPVAETSMREIMGKTPLSLALSDKRQSVAEETKQLMQAIMDEYQSGIEIYEVNLLAVDAPEPVVDAFIDVLAAQQEKETLQNQALKYRDGILPVAQGQVEKMIKDAQGYKEAVVSRSRGDSERFLSIYNEYKNAKDVTRRRMYLDTMEEILSGMPKVILSEQSSKQVLPYLPLPAVQKVNPTPAPENGQSDISRGGAR